ncbi:MAG: MEDS domain-containing protein [Myxococcota bacterium]
METADARNHLVTLYSNDPFLAEAVARFVGAALGEGDGALVVATPPHWRRVRERLEESAFDVDAVVDRGQLVVLDAAETLQELLGSGLTDLGLAVGPRLAGIRAVTRRPRVRVFGEMVNLLWEGGEHAAALRLEALWDALLSREAATLLCAYRSDPLSPDADILDVARAHDRVVAAADGIRVLRGLERAVDEVLGPGRAAMLRVVVAAEHPSVREEGSAELLVLWLRARMPKLGERVMVLASRYAE